MEAPEVNTWADVKNDPDLKAISIAIHAFDVVTRKEWVKSAMEPRHWDHISSIAETGAEQRMEHPGQGFSWVDAAVVGECAIGLEPPAHLADLIEAGDRR